MQPIINCETDLVKYLKGNGLGEIWKIYFPNFDLLGFEYPVYGVLSYKKIGSVDIAFLKNGNIYFVEVKFDPSNKSGDFWDSLKIIGYVKSAQMEKFSIHIKPVIMINKDILRYDYRAILGALDIGWIVFNLDVDNRLVGFNCNIY